VIHILEADYNLVLIEIFGRRLMWNCETNGKLGDLQDGFKKGRSTTRTLLHNELVADFNKRRRINNFIGMTDISGCFDCIIPSLISLLNKKNGCPQNAVTMHAMTLQQGKIPFENQTRNISKSLSTLGNYTNIWQRSGCRGLSRTMESGERATI
jgi:hypothetical protein